MDVNASQRRKQIIRDTLTSLKQPGNDLKIILALRRHIKELDDELQGSGSGQYPMLETQRVEMNEVLQEFILDLAMMPDPPEEEIKK
jgi:hypothetical protein